MGSRPENAFLANMSASDFAGLEPNLVPVVFTFGDTLHSVGDKVNWVYFPTSSILSLIVRGRSGNIEASLTGNEGACGVVEACARQPWGVDVAVQVDGEAFRCSAHSFAEMAVSSRDFAKAAWRLAALQLAECRQSTYCQSNHKVDQRLARWLVESQERSGGRNPLPITQEFLSDMLGVQRTTVTSSATNFQAKGLFQNHRGRIDVTDLAKLEAEACECRGAMMEERKRLRLEALPIAKS